MATVDSTAALVDAEVGDLPELEPAAMPTEDRIERPALRVLHLAV